MRNYTQTDYWLRNHDVPQSNGATLRIVQDDQNQYAVAWTGSDLENGGNVIDGGYAPRIILSRWGDMDFAKQHMNELAEMDSFKLNDSAHMLYELRRIWNYPQPPNL
jgi:hypothetical protein